MRHVRGGFPSLQQRQRVAVLAGFATLTAMSLVLGGCGATSVQTYDVVVANGRVMDPETGLDAVRHVGIVGSTIRALSERPLHGTLVIDANGLVVAPGFIDLSSYGQDLENNRAQVRDGVTTALELENGPWDVDAWYDEREGRRLINYGASVGHTAVRRKVMQDFDERALGGRVGSRPPGATTATDRASYDQATDEELEEILQHLELGLARGALAVGTRLGLTPGVSRWEVYEVFRAAARHGALVVPDLRFFGSAEPNTWLISYMEVLSAAVLAGASLHVCHICSMAPHEIDRALHVIDQARSRGLDVTAACHPYPAAGTPIESTDLDEGWQQKLRMGYGDLEWAATGERLTRESFARYRAQGGFVIMHYIPERTVTAALAHPVTGIVSEGELRDGVGHPRSSGTFGRLLGRYVREEPVLELMEALRKITLMPAQRLEARVTAMTRKGRVQVGADADLTVFDPERVEDRATFTEPDLPTAGIMHVLVNGVAVVRNGEIMEGVLPGRPVRAPTGS